MSVFVAAAYEQEPVGGGGRRRTGRMQRLDADGAVERVVEVGRVGAGAAVDDDVVQRVDHAQDVVVVVAVHEVAPGTAGEVVVADVAAEDVVAVAADDDVAAHACVDVERPRRRVRPSPRCRRR